MGESFVGVLNNEDKMGEKTASNPVLEVSVSFGRFENDALSWEKWSTFSPNKYMEEVEKYATAGSVAQKKAYFEAHYKKIAARKAEIQEQEKQLENNPFRSYEQNGEHLVENPLRSCEQNGGDMISKTGEVDLELDASHQLCFSEETEETILIGEAVAEEEVAHTQPIESEGSSVDEKKEFDRNSDCSEINKPEEDVRGTEVDTPSQDIKELPQNLDKDETKESNMKEEIVKSERAKVSKKIAPTNKEKHTATTKKKPVSTVAKTPQLSTPRVSKPTSTIITPVTRSSATRGTDSSLSRKKNPSAGEVKKVGPKSLHVSLSLASPNSDPASLTTTRKSLIMERMGDKDIVRRAFKTFQNSFNQLKSSNEEKSDVPKQVHSHTKGIEPRVSTSTPTRKENEGSLKKGGADNRRTKPFPSFGLRSDVRADKRNESTKKSGEKVSTKNEEKTRNQSKSKEQKEAEIKKLGQRFSFKATPMPAFYKGERLSKSCLDKEVPGMGLIGSRKPVG